jgi:hypothetical protein
MIKLAIPTAAIAIMNMTNPPKTVENPGETVPLTIPVAAVAIMEKIKATATPIDTIGKITLIKLA